MDSYSILKKFQMHDLRFSPEFHRVSGTASVSRLAEGERIWPHKSPKAASTLGRENKNSHIFTPACVLKNQHPFLPHHFWHSYVSSGSAGWFEDDLSLLHTQSTLWLKPQWFFLPFLAERRCWALKDRPPVIICDWINLSYPVGQRCFSCILSEPQWRLQS